MLANVPLFIGLRYTRSKRRHQFISFISAFSLIGMVLGVLSLITVLSVMNGFDRELKQRILNVVPHGFIESPTGLSRWQSLSLHVNQQPHIMGVSPYISGFGLLNYSGRSEGVSIKAIDPYREGQVSQLSQHMLLGELTQLADQRFGIVLGSLLARSLNVALGDKVRLTLPQLSITPAGVFPRAKSFTVIGVFEVGAQMDQNLAVMHLTDAQRLYRMPEKVTGLQIKVDDIYRAQSILQTLAERLPTSESSSFVVKDWSQTQGSLFAAVKMEKTVITTLLMIVVAVAAFNIVSSLVLMVSDKRGDIAVLRTLGLSPRQVMAVFMIQGAAIGWVGVIIGSLLGCLLALFVGDIVSALESLTGGYLFDPNVYFISELPSQLQWQDVLLVASCGAVLSVLATVYPAYRAAKVSPAEALRYE